jgi:adenylosuccinate lyase
MENMTLWHERDISHSSNERIILPDSCLLLDYMLNIFCSIIKGLIINVEKMRNNMEITQGLVFSQRILLALVEKGLSRQESYVLVQRNAMKAWKEKIKFLELLLSDRDVTAALGKTELETIFDYTYFTKYVDQIFERLGLIELRAKPPSDDNRLTPQSL